MNAYASFDLLASRLDETWIMERVRTPLPAYFDEAPRAFTGLFEGRLLVSAPVVYLFEARTEHAPLCRRRNPGHGVGVRANRESALLRCLDLNWPEHLNVEVRRLSHTRVIDGETELCSPFCLFTVTLEWEPAGAAAPVDRRLPHG